MQEPSTLSHMNLQTELVSRMAADSTFEKFYTGEISDDVPVVLPRDFTCLKSLMETYNSKCGVMTDYSLKYVKYFVIECE